MTPNKKNLLRAVSVLLMAALCFSLAACNGSGKPGETGGPTSAGGTETTYQVEVLSEGGVALSDISVYIYAQESLQDLIAVANTDAAGKAGFTCQAGSGYVAVLGNVPAGYKTEAFYPITGESTQIKLPTQLVEGDLSEASYKLGSVMQDFSFTDCTGTEYKLSQLLESKRAVVLHFFDLNTTASKMELPEWQEAYPEFADTAAVLAMSPGAVSNEDIQAYVTEKGITFPMGQCDARWEAAMNLLTYPTTVVIDRYGMVALEHDAAFKNSTEIKDVLAFFTAEDYTQTAVENYEDILVSEPEEENQNPLDIATMTSFQLILEPGTVHYMNVFKLSNVWLQVNHPDVFVEYGSRTFYASGGSVGLMVSAISSFEPSQVGFGTSGTETITVTVTLSHLPGTWDNPYTLQLGEFSASVSAGNDQGVYFKYTAPEDGYFRLQCLGASTGVEYTFSVMNLTTSVTYMLGEESEIDPATGNPVVKVPMNEGEQISVSVAALPNDSNVYPAAAFRMLAQFTAGEIEDVVVVEKIPYAITVTDENRQPVFGVNITLVGTVPETPEGGEGTEPTEPAEPHRVTMSTGEDGIASGYLPKDSYTGTIQVPAGYIATTTAFELTPEAPFVSLMLKTHVIEMADYTVRIIDEDGAPVPGVLITIGTTYGTTDADGAYTVNLEKADYTVVLGVPEGYTADSISVPFPTGSTVLGITLKKGSGELEGIEYTVKVVDANGAGQSGIVVTFLQEGQPVTMAPADDSGVAVATLVPGDYTIALTSASGASLKFDKTQAALSAEKTVATVTVAADITGSSHKTAWWGGYYLIPVGSSWDDLTNTVNYYEEFSCFMYVFRPTQSGIYRFSAGGGTLGYYGGINFPFGPSLSTQEDGYFEITIKDGEFANNNKPSLVFGLVPTAGQTEATVTILRTADAPAELPEEDYIPAQAPMPFTLTGSASVTYVDLTGTAEIEKGADGYYYLDGKKLYMNIGRSAPYITLGEMVGIVYDSTTGGWGTSNMASGMKGLVYEDTTPVAIVDFTDCMKEFARASDPKNGLYPLNDDLIYMVKTHGDYAGWWKLDQPTSLFGDKENLNEDILWMFAVCYQ